MNSHVMPSRVQMEPTLLKKLVDEVQETVATNVNVQHSTTASSFKAIDLWNIQRRGRYASNASARKLGRQCGIVKTTLG